MTSTFVRSTKKALMMWALRSLVHTRRPYTVRLDGLTLRVLPGVFSPKRFFSFRVSQFLARHAGVQAGDEVLEIGTGTGMIALLLASRAARVVATDINPAAVACARENAARNRRANVQVREGDLFAPLRPDERFDAVLFNFPFYFGTPKTPLDHAYYCGESGELVRRFAAGVGAHLRPGGHAAFLFASIEDNRFLGEAFAEHGLELTAGERFYVPGLDFVIAYQARPRAVAVAPTEEAQCS